MPETMKPATAQLLEYLRRVTDGRVKVPALRDAMRAGMSADDVLKAVDRVRDSRARLEIQSAPKKYRRGPPVSLAPINEPTQEWKTRYAGQIETRRVSSDIREKGYRVRHVMEQHGDKFSLDMRDATARFLEDSQWHERIKVADWNSNGGGSSGSRLGGIGNVPQMIREAHHRFDWIDQRLDPGLRAVSEYLILRVRSHTNDAPFSLEDFGRYMFPGERDKRSLECLARGAVWCFGGHLVWLYKQPGCPRVIRISDEERELAWEQQNRKLETA